MRAETDIGPAPACFSGWAEIGLEEGLLWSMARNVP
jgi:hypothetical protein